MSKTRMSPEWWREYRRKKAEQLREYNRARRQTPKHKAQRHASEARRRAKRREEEQKRYREAEEVKQNHELFGWAKSILNKSGYPKSRGGVLKFKEEVLEEDLMSVAILARLECRDPIEAIRSYRAKERDWWAHTSDYLAEVIRETSNEH